MLKAWPLAYRFKKYWESQSTARLSVQCQSWNRYMKRDHTFSQWPCIYREVTVSCLLVHLSLKNISILFINACQENTTFHKKKTQDTMTVNISRLLLNQVCKDFNSQYRIMGMQIFKKWSILIVQWEILAISIYFIYSFFVKWNIIRKFDVISQFFYTYFHI